MRGALRKSLAPSPLAAMAAMATGPAQRTCVLRTKERESAEPVLQSLANTAPEL